MVLCGFSEIAFPGNIWNHSGFLNCFGTPLDHFTVTVSEGRFAVHDVGDAEAVFNFYRAPDTLPVIFFAVEDAGVVLDCPLQEGAFSSPFSTASFSTPGSNTSFPLPSARQGKFTAYQHSTARPRGKAIESALSKPFLAVT
ncbi:hypothetical protein, unlikely [Trypanosoma congolense IL3000]|uniref:Uncharacterized protein n=1 Tax=Trypanosoma congolense (strain IL3000) TaxID=1068625 RepID=F9W3H9_TRYCI|nr:hypothetical protein, unlikely [Trypanosoma congolense IL3000]